MLTQIINGHILTPQGWLKDGSVLISDGKILEVTNSDLAVIGATVIDAKGMYIVPGFISMHVHGGGGHDFTEGSKEAFTKAVSAHLKHGATSIFPTLSSSTFDTIRQAVTTCEELMPSGHMVLYQPKEIQKYVYYVEDHPEVFWIHFTGYDVKNILNYHGIPLDKHVFYSGTLPDYKMLFRKIIRELQQCEYGYEDYIASLFNIILLLVSRQQQESEKTTTSIPEEIEAAVAYFNENYNTKVSVDNYAESLHISTNWFIRNFKLYMKISPAQYILSLRMVNAQSLLENTEYNIGEIAEIVGYDNPLYFSRVFKKEYGVSPAQYRKNLEESTEK